MSGESDFANWFGWGTGGTNIGGETSSARQSEIQEQEKKMLDPYSGVGQLVTDPKTGLPVLPEYSKEREIAETEKESNIQSLFLGADKQRHSMLKKLYKMGVKKHGRLERETTLADEDIQRGIEKEELAYGKNVTSLENTAFARIDEMRNLVDRTKRTYEKTGMDESVYRDIGKGLYEPGGEYEKKGAFEEYETTALGKVNPKKLYEEAYEYDYLTGKRKTTV